MYRVQYVYLNIHSIQISCRNVVLINTKNIDVKFGHNPR